MNHSNKHWSVIIIDKKKGIWFHLDPLNSKAKPNQRSSDLIEELKKSGHVDRSCKNVMPKISIQRDGWSCGVMILVVILIFISIIALFISILLNIAWDKT